MNTDSHPCRKARFLIPFAILGFLALFSYVVYALWNGVLVDVVPVKAITYWQALGLLVLCKILFGGFPCRGRGFGPPWKEHMMARKWASMTPEEREQMREKMRRRFGDWPRPPWMDDAPAKPETPSKPSGA